MKRLLSLIALIGLLASTAHAADSVNAGDTSVITQFKINDTAATDNSGKTGIVYNAAGLSCYYSRNNAGSATAITLVTMTPGTWASGGFVQRDATNMPGVYQLGVPNAAFAAGARDVFITCKGAAGGAQADIHIPIYTTPTVLVSDGTGAGQIDTNSGAVVNVTTCGDVTTKTGYRLSGTGVSDIWDLDISGKTTAGTAGKKLNDASGGGSSGSTFRSW